MTRIGVLAGLEFRLKAVGYGLSGCFALVPGFVALPTDAAQDAPLTFGLALWSNLPVTLAITKLEVASSHPWFLPSISSFPNFVFLS